MHLSPLQTLAVCALLVVSAGASYSQEFEASEIAIELHGLYSCGGCPVYELSVDGQGTVRFVGLRNVATVGHAEARIPSSTVLELFNALFRSRLLDGPAVYNPPDIMRRDGERFSQFQVRVHDTVERLVRVRLGDRNYEFRLVKQVPAEIENFLRKMLESTEAERWIGPTAAAASN